MQLQNTFTIALIYHILYILFFISLMLTGFLGKFCTAFIKSRLCSPRVQLENTTENGISYPYSTFILFLAVCHSQKVV